MKFIKHNETKIEMHFNDKNINAMNNFLKNAENSDNFVVTDNFKIQITDENREQLIRMMNHVKNMKKEIKNAEALNSSEPIEFEFYPGLGIFTYNNETIYLGFLYEYQ